MGYYGKIGDKVFFDANNNGLQDYGEAGVEGVTVTLLGAGSDWRFGTSDDITLTQVTNSNGNYKFSGLRSGKYKAFFTDIPAGFQFTTPDVGKYKYSIDSDVIDFATGGTDVIYLKSYESNLKIDAGLIALPNANPDAVDNFYTVSAGNIINIPAGNNTNPLGNDIDADGDALFVQALNGEDLTIGGDDFDFADGSTGGQFTIFQNGQFSFDPQGDFNDLFIGEFRDTTVQYTIADGKGGTDTANITVRVEGQQVRNNDPNAADDIATAAFNSPVVFNVLGNDSDPDGDPLSVTSINGQSVSPGDSVNVGDGIVTLFGDGFLDFTPNAGFVGDATFEYHADDGNGGEDTANVTVTVNGPVNNDPNANDDSATTPLDTPVLLNVLGNDSDPDGDPLSVTSINGQSVAPGDTVDVGDGTVSVLNNGSLFFTPDAGFTGDATFEYHADDGNGGEDLANVTVTVNGPVNNDPNANDDSATTPLDTPVLLNVLGNDSDPDGDPLSVTSINGQSVAPGDTVDVGDGTVSVLNNGSLFFTPDAGFTGDATFEYHADDGNGGEDLANVTVTVNGPVNNASVGDTVFLDANGNGIQDAGESGVQGVQVTLTGAGNDGVIGTADDTTATEFTNGTGNYQFGNLAAGDYKVTFSGLPAGFEFTTPNVGSDSLDSDADPFTGKTDVFTLAAGESNQTIDAGLVQTAPPAGDKDRDCVFLDANGNGVLDAGESGVAGVTVTLNGAGADNLFDTADDITATDVTDANGYYQFANITAGDYQVTFSNLPSGFEFTTANVGDDRFDSDADPATGKTQIVGLADGATILSLDAGLVAVSGGVNIIPGTSGNDDLIGTSGADRLVGFGGIDRLTGNDGPDIFVLGDETGGFYDKHGYQDFADIIDFAAGQDTIQLNGSMGDYAFKAVNGGTWIFQGDEHSGELVADVFNASVSDVKASVQFV